MLSTQQRPFTASTNKLAYAQVFSAKDRRQAVRTPSLLQRLVARRHRSYPV